MSEPAAFDWTVLDLDDQPVIVREFKGKPVFLNFWATWCGPCVREMPSIDSLAREPAAGGQIDRVRAVSRPTKTPTVRRQFLKGKKLGMTFLRVKDGKIPQVFYSEGIPATFLIAPDGRIAATEIGAADWHSPEVVEFMEKLADAK